MRMKENINFGDKWHYKNCIIDSKKNYKFDLGVEGLTLQNFFNSPISLGKSSCYTFTTL